MTKRVEVSQVNPSIIQRVSVNVMTVLKWSGSSDFSVHSNFMCAAGIAVSSNGIPARTGLFRTPVIFIDLEESFLIDERNFAASELNFNWFFIRWAVVR